MNKQLLSLMACLLVGLGCWAQSITIGGHRAVQDTLNSTWLCSIPQSLFGQDFTATVDYDENVRTLVIEGTAVANGSDYVFSRVAGGKNYSVTAYMGQELVTGYITFTWLPIVELDGDFGYSYNYGTVTVNEPDSAYAEPMKAKLKWRGGATNVDGKHKRNYRIKFVNDDSTKCNRRFFGLRNDNSWILDAGQMDFLRVRNRVSTDLWLDFARQPWYADTLKNVRNGSRGQMVEVILNGAYHGIYNMCEPIDRKQLKLERYDEANNEFHGVIWFANSRTNTTKMSYPAKRDKGKTYWDGFELKYPDAEETNRVNWTAMEEAVLFAYRADNSDLDLRIDSMGYYFDLPVMMDYYIFVSTIQALDNESKNIFYACYDTQDNHRLAMVPWDIDICLGANYAPGANIPSMVKPERQVTEWMMHIPMADMMDVEAWRKDVNRRYYELRETVLHTDSLVNRYKAAIDELENSGAAAREEGRWSKDSDLAGKTLDLSNEMVYVEDWIRRRMAYMDEFVMGPPVGPSLRGDVNLDGVVNISDVNAVIDCIFKGEYNENADVNGDGVVNITDVNTVIGIILS